MRNFLEVNRIGTFNSAASAYIRRNSGPAASTWYFISPNPDAPPLTAFVRSSSAPGLVMSVLANHPNTRPGYCERIACILSAESARASKCAFEIRQPVRVNKNETPGVKV